MQEMKLEKGQLDLLRRYEAESSAKDVRLTCLTEELEKAHKDLSVREAEMQDLLREKGQLYLKLGLCEADCREKDERLNQLIEKFEKNEAVLKSFLSRFMQKLQQRPRGYAGMRCS